MVPSHLAATRREFLASLAAGLGISSVHQVAWAASAIVQSTLGIRYRTEPGRLAGLMPPGLDADDRSEVLIEFFRFHPSNSAEQSDEDPLQIVAAYIRVKHGGRSGWLLLSSATDSERWRIHGREFLGLPLKDGEIELERDGAGVAASFNRRGNLILRIETALTDSSPDQDRSGGQPVFSFDYRLNYDWKACLVGPETARLVEFGSIRASGGLEASVTPAFQRGCDLERTVVTWPEATPLDPLAELPVIEILDAAYRESGNPSRWLLTGGGDPEPKTLKSATPASFEPWCVLRYDRPVDRNRVWMPDGWRQTSSAFRLTDPEIKQWRARKEIIIDPVDVIDMQFMVDRELHAELVPPPCRGGIRPILRLMALRVDSSEISPEPFDELWLFASCLVENHWAWYPIAHIAGPGGDVIFGRETFGYPSKMGDVSTVLRPDGFDLAAQRAGRQFVSASGATAGFSTGTSLDEMTVVSLRVDSFRGAAPTKGLLIEQPWYFHGRKLRAVRETLEIVLPEPDGAARASVRDPWFELNPVTPLSAATFEGGGMQRGPGRVVGEVTDVGQYYLERCDGLLPGSALDAPAEPSSFRPRRVGGDTSSRTS